ncbi:hypothetical protein L6R52_06040, partial [Myxococcota bacterium]|nr:hypothetical protein [Myxococcota bacterium]
MATTTNSTTHRNRSGDAQMTMIEAAYYRQQLSLGELSSLAEDQKANNEQMKAIRGLQDKLRTFLSAGGRDGLKEIDENEMAELVRDAAALGIDLTTYQQQLFPTAAETPQAARPASTPNTGLQTPAAGARPSTRGASEAELEVQADRLG